MSPALIVTDRDLAPTVDAAVVDAARRRAGRRRRRSTTPRPTAGGRPRVDETDVAVMIPTSGTTGRSKLVMQTHLAYVMAGEGFPFWMQLTTTTG